MKTYQTKTEILFCTNENYQNKKKYTEIYTI